MASSTRVGLVMRPIASYRLRDTGYSPFTRDKVVRLLSDLGDEQGILALVELGINSECTDLANQVDLLSFEEGDAVAVRGQYEVLAQILLACNSPVDSSS